MQQFNSDQFLEATSDFHLLLFIATMDMYPMKVQLLLQYYNLLNFWLFVHVFRIIIIEYFSFKVFLYHFGIIEFESL